MVMADNETADDQNQVSSDGCEPKSPWRRPVDKGADAPVMGAETWPALSDAQRSKNMDTLAKPSAAADGDNSAVPAAKVNPQASAWQEKTHGSGNGNPSHKHGQSRHHKGGSKRSQIGVPPYNVPIHYYPPVTPPEFPPMVPGLPIFPGYCFQPCPPPFTSAGNQQAFGPRDGILVQQHMLPRPFLRAPILRPGPGFVAGPTFPGAAPVYYLPAPGPVRAPYQPHFVVHPVNPVVPMIPPEQLALRDNIVKQIEYYFSDENLQTDAYLIAQMDDQGWVPISIIANFNRVKKMTTDIQFILDALQSSRSVDVQGDKVRKRENWSRYFMASVENASLSSAQSISDIFIKSSINELKNDEMSEDMIERSSGGINQSASDIKISAEQSMKAKTQKFDGKNANEGSKNSLHDDAGQTSVGGRVNSNDILSPNSSVYLTDIIMINSLSSKSTRFVGCSTERGNVLVDSAANLDHSSNDFSSTFLLDEELEMEHNMPNEEDHNLVRRIDDEDDEILVHDEDVERLVIVTQNNNLGAAGTPKHVSEYISSELASTINDGLYFYEQELKAKRSCSKQNRSSGEGKDGCSRLPSIPSANLSMKANESSVGESGTGSGNSGNRWKLNKGSSKHQLTTYKQRFFSGNFRTHGIHSNSNGAISESPPSSPIGFYFSSTPPENHSLRDSKLSVSPCGNITDSSPPVGSWPKSFLPFPHPSHQLLEENGFKQQKYLKYRKHCLNGRKKLGTGHSEDMNSLYSFWSYFLGDTFVPSMYDEFCKLALEDAADGYNYGLECLFRFYSYGLEKEFRGDLYQEFEQLALDFYRKGNLYGLEKYWAFHHYREARDGKNPLKKRPELDKLLREEFCSLDDFHRAKYKDRITVKDESGNDRSMTGIGTDGAGAA